MIFDIRSSVKETLSLDEKVMKLNLGEKVEVK